MCAMYVYMYIEIARARVCNSLVERIGVDARRTAFVQESLHE